MTLNAIMYMVIVHLQSSQFKNICSITALIEFLHIPSCSRTSVFASVRGS